MGEKEGREDSSGGQEFYQAFDMVRGRFVGKGDFARSSTEGLPGQAWLA